MKIQVVAPLSFTVVVSVDGFTEQVAMRSFMSKSLITSTTTLGELAVRFLQHGITERYVLPDPLGPVGAQVVTLVASDGSRAVGKGPNLWEAMDDAMAKILERIGRSF